MVEYFYAGGNLTFIFFSYHIHYKSHSLAPPLITMRQR